MIRESAEMELNLNLAGKTLMKYLIGEPLSCNGKIRSDLEENSIIATCRSNYRITELSELLQ